MLHLIITIGQKKRLDTANLDSYILRQEKWLSSYSNVYCKRVRKPCDLAQQTLHLLRNPWTGCSNCWRSPCRKECTPDRLSQDTARGFQRCPGVARSCSSPWPRLQTRPHFARKQRQRLRGRCWTVRACRSPAPKSALLETTWL